MTARRSPVVVRAAAPSGDPFRRMLAWSLVLHLGVLTGITLAARYSPAPTVLPFTNVAWITPSLGGANPEAGGGDVAPPKEEPPPPPPKELPPEEEPEEEPRVVRPKAENREQLALPDAREARRPKRPKDEPSGIQGRDVSRSRSATLKSQLAGYRGLGLGGAGSGSPFDHDFEYAYYVQQMLGRINQRWNRVVVQGSAVVVVKFTILRNGSLRDVEIEQSSSVRLLDRAAERAVFLADPLPPLPNPYPRDRVGVHLRFEYTSSR